jgi:serine/threonine protein kinase
MQFMLNATNEMIDTVLATSADNMNVVWSNISPHLAAYISTTTALKLKAQHGYVFDGLIAAGMSGQRKSAIYYAFDNRGAMMCAKVYFANYQEDFEREVSNLIALNGCRNTVNLIEHFALGQNFAIVIPLYGLSLYAYLEAMNFLIHEDVALRIVKDVLNALCDIHKRGYCFADVKVTNICLVVGEPKCVLIDAASAVPFGDAIIEYTTAICLGHSPVATPTFDLYCVASLVFLLKFGRFEHMEYTKTYMLEMLKEGKSKLGCICCACLNSNSIDDVLALY